MLGRSLLPVALVPLAACVPSLTITPRFGQLELDGELAISAAGLNASNDLDDLGLDDQEGEFNGAIDFKWGGPHVTVSTVSSAFSGTGVLEADFDLGGTVITAGTTVDSDLDIGVDTAVITWDIAPTEMVEIGVGLGVSALDFDSSFTDLSTGDVVATDEQVPIPVVAGRVGVGFGKFAVTGLIAGVTLAVDGNDITYYDLDVSGRYSFFDLATGTASLTLGFRQITTDVQYDDDDDEIDLDMDFSGPYIGFELRF